jgi:hypothetical protein
MKTQSILDVNLTTEHVAMLDVLHDFITVHYPVIFTFACSGKEQGERVD